jgi:chemotaxis protein MotB
MAKKKKEEESGESMAWMVTFSDLITLMFTFFVLLLSLCSLEAGKIQQMESAASDAIGALEEGQYSEVATQVIMSSKKKIDEEALKSENLFKQFSGLKMKALDVNMAGNMEFAQLERGYSMVVRDDLLFSAGRDELKPEGIPVLREIGVSLKEFGGKVLVEGHTDDLPVSTGRFPSNWELSTARAVTIARYFVEKAEVDPEIVSAVGYGDSKPKVSNDTPENRGKNRRVEIILVPEIIFGR